MDFKQKLSNYADAIITRGVCIKKGQRLEIVASIENKEMAQMLMLKAFENGAADVYINWSDYEADRIRYMNAPAETFETYPEWQLARENRIKPEDWSLVMISTPDPEIFKDVNPAVLEKANQTRAKAIQHIQQMRMNLDIKWCIALSSSEAWAKKVYPDLSGEAAVSKLWDSIFMCSRVDSVNYQDKWDEQLKKLKAKGKMLNDRKYEKLRYTAPGTNFEIKPISVGEWTSCGTKAYDGTMAIINIPSEEIFIVPDRYSANGKITSTMPLVYNGNIIKNLWFEFKDGKVVDFGAEEGKELIGKFMEADESAKYLGEVALVPFDSPISKLNTIFYNTLFDENASCHLALGNGITMATPSIATLSSEEKQKLGFNISTVHLDFMVGSEKLNIMGILPDGTEEAIFINGNWA